MRFKHGMSIIMSIMHLRLSIGGGGTCGRDLQMVLLRKMCCSRNAPLVDALVVARLHHPAGMKWQHI